MYKYEIYKNNLLLIEMEMLKIWFQKKVWEKNKEKSLAKDNFHDCVSNTQWTVERWWNCIQQKTFLF